MTLTQLRALELMAGSTGNLVDVHRRYAALLYARSIGIEQEAKQFLFKRRFEWLNWQTVTQRKWQSKTRRQARAIHHDDVEIRERYVRCKA